MHTYPYLEIRNRTIGYERLASALKDLPRTPESAVMLASIANDPIYPVYHRRLCVLQLFRQYVSSGMTLGRVAEMLDNPLWLSEDNVHEIKAAIGKIPVRFTDEDSVFSLVVFPEAERNTSAVYIRVKGKLSKERLVEFLRKKDPQQKMGKTILLEIGILQSNP